MVDIRSTAAEIRRGKKKEEEEEEERNYRAKIYMVSLLHRATIIRKQLWVKESREISLVVHMKTLHKAPHVTTVESCMGMGMTVIPRSPSNAFYHTQ